MELLKPLVCIALVLITWHSANGQSLTGSARVAIEDWAQARSFIQRSPWKEWLQQEKVRVDRWAAQPRDQPNWQAGWAHDFIEPKTGAFIPWTPAVDCSNFGASDMKTSRACIMMQRTYNIHAALAAARLGLLTGDSHYLRWAGDQLDIYRQIYIANSDRSRGVLFSQLLDEATVTTSLTESVRLLRPHVEESRANAWCHDLLKPMANAMLGARREVSNIAVWYNAAAAMAAMECDDPVILDDALADNTLGLSKLFEIGLSEDGFWYELSPQYQSYVTTALSELLISASLHNEIGRFQALWARLGSMLVAPNRLALGNGDGPITNDANKASSFPDAMLALQARRVLTTPLGLKTAINTLDWSHLLDPPSPSALSTPTLEASVGSSSEWVNGARTLVLREKAWSGILRGGQVARFHAHQDTLSIELKYGSTWLFRNSVTPGYGSELQRNFYKLSAAVSTPLVDGNGTSNWFRPLASYTVAPAEISAKLTSFAKDVSVDRTLSVEASGDLRDTVTFTTPPTSQRVFSQLYHSDCTLPDVPRNEGANPVQKVSPYLLHWEMLAQGASPWSVRMTCAGKTFVTTVTGSRAFTVWRGDGPALGPARRRMALLIELAPGATASLTVVHRPADTPPN